MTAQNLRPHCPISNPELEKAILALPSIDEIPHCFLQNLHRAVFLSPIANANGDACSDIRADSRYTFVPSSEGGKSYLALFTSVEQLGHWRSEQVHAHIHLSLLEAVNAARNHKYEGLILNPGSTRHMRLSHQAFDKVLAISPRHQQQKSETTESELAIEQGDEMIVSTPDPAPPEVFLHELSRVLRTIDGLRDAFLFELAWKDTSGDLVLGLQLSTPPRPGQIEAALDQISSEAREAAAGFDHFDLMLLDDPALIEVVSSTVPSLLASGPAN
ncbi:MAG TPA: SseB family protein [Candidatus Ozemobacteraceae bacterium]|nr:SseB family protein [Candidatus Ozemobacteraceae bacterium]